MGQDRAVIDVRSRWKMEHIPEAEGDAFETAVSWDGREPGIRQSSCMRRQAAPVVRLTRIFARTQNAAGYGIGSRVGG